MKQRVCIAIAISLRPKVIIADEPTSALDVVVQRQVMETLRRVQESSARPVILVGHDMGLMAQFVDRLGVMYAGELVEVAGAGRSSASRSIRTPAADREPADARAKGIFAGHPGPAAVAAQSARRAARSTRAARSDAALLGRRSAVLREVRPNRLVACHLYDGRGVTS